MKIRVLKLPLILILMLLYTVSNADSLPDSLESYVNEILETIEANSMYVQQVDWSLIKKNFYEEVGEAKNKEDLLPAFKTLFTRLGDFHGSFLYKGKLYAMPKEDIKVSDGLSRGFKYGTRVRTEILEGKYGYVYVPAMMSWDSLEQYRKIKQLQDSICKLNEAGVESYILDLRLNLGGDMCIMLGGLASFYEDGLLGKFIKPDSSVTDLAIRDGNIYEGEIQRTRTDKICMNDNPQKIAVLTSNLTSSSGEIAAIAFKGSPETKLIGENTSGYTTAIEKFPIDQQTELHLSISYITDKNGLYSKYIEPDIEVIDGDNFDHLNEDAKIRAALIFLKGN